MATLVRDPPPAEFQALLERRRRLGQDLLDEVWDGVHHMNPAPHGRHVEIQQQLAELLGPLARECGLRARVGIFNVGKADDYRVPDGGLFRSDATEVFFTTVALAIEIVSPGDETWAKLGFYAAHGVDELLIVDPETRRVDWLALDADGEDRPVELSRLIRLGPAALSQQLDWPL